jgi:hypothetical protein
MDIFLWIRWLFFSFLDNRTLEYIPWWQDGCISAYRCRFTAEQPRPQSHSESATAKANRAEVVSNQGNTRRYRSRGAKQLRRGFSCGLEMVRRTMDNNMYGDTTKHSGTCTIMMAPASERWSQSDDRDRLSCNFVILHNQVRKRTTQGLTQGKPINGEHPILNFPAT